MTQKKGNFPTIRTRLADLFDFDNLMNEPFFESPVWTGWRTKVPATNIRETDAAFSIEVAAPGLKKEDFHVDVDNGLLEIKVEKETENKEEKQNYTRREYSYTNFCRSFTLPETVDAAKVEAQYKDGVLNITLPKLPVVKTESKKAISVA